MIKQQGVTNRGFALAIGIDHYGAPYSIQDSSLAEPRCIWLGSHDEVSKRMHLTQAQAAELLPLLKSFVETGSIVIEADRGNWESGK